MVGEYTQMPMYLEAVRSWFLEMGVEAKPCAAVYRSFGKNLHSTEEPQNSIAMIDPEFAYDKNSKGIKQPLLKKNVTEFAKKPLTEQNAMLLEQIASVVDQIREGTFAVQPGERACDICMFGELCRVEQWGRA